jgi:hypothetical protein
LRPGAIASEVAEFAAAVLKSLVISDLSALFVYVKKGKEGLKWGQREQDVSRHSPETRVTGIDEHHPIHYNRSRAID